MQHPVASGGMCPPDPLLQRSTSVFRPPLQKILDPPLNLKLTLLGLTCHQYHLEFVGAANNSCQVGRLIRENYNYASVNDYANKTKSILNFNG